MFIQDEDLCVCVLTNIRGMLEKPPELMEEVSTGMYHCTVSFCACCCAMVYFKYVYIANCATVGIFIITIAVVDQMTLKIWGKITNQH